MGVMKSKKMKGIEMLCASPASTSICNSTITKPLNRLNSYLVDHYKNFTCSAPPCVSQLLPLAPRKFTPSDPNHNNLAPRRKSSADVYDLRNYHKQTTNSSRHEYLLGDLGCLSSDMDYPTKESSALLPTSTSLLRSDQDKELRKSRSERGRVPSSLNTNLVHKEANNNNNKTSMSLALANPSSNKRVIKSEHSSVNDYDSPAPLRKSSCLGPSPEFPEQVVALRVSLHCKACEAKLRKHLSRIQGVTSFSIDKETKKVVVIGKMSPSDVLTSISKVKNAQFWQSPASASSSSSSSSSSSTSSKFGSTAMLEPKYLI